MTSSKGTRIVWQVEYRRNSDRGWRRGPKYETRKDARTDCATQRWIFGFGNTRVVRLELPHKAKKEEA